MNNPEQKQVYLIGAGGAGMSALAKYLHEQGYMVSGSDATYSDHIKDLEESYHFNFTGDQRSEHITDQYEMVIYTASVEKGNPEFDTAKELGVVMYSYAEYLGVISQNKKTIAIAGTNGKTTTTTMVGELLVDQEFDPTIIVGGVMQKFNSNYKSGDSEWFVVEACEYKHSFLNLTPQILVVTNISPDHMDYFETLDNYYQAFIDLITKMAPGTHLVCNTADPALERVVAVAQNQGLNIINYSEVSIERVTIPGRHNIQNAQAAASVIDLLDGDSERAHIYLSESFKGSKRRLELLGTTKYGHPVYDDYAHNPDALEKLITGVREKYSDHQIAVFFQPHLYSRTKDLFNEFVDALRLADHTYMLPIYAAREPYDPEVSSQLLAQALQTKYPNINSFSPSSFQEAQELFVQQESDQDMMVLVVGAGDIWKLGQMLVQ